MEILDTTIATASQRHVPVRGAVAVGLGLFARKAASLEAMAGQVYLAVAVARLVGLHVTPTPHDTAGRSKS